MMKRLKKKVRPGKKPRAGSNAIPFPEWPQDPFQIKEGQTYWGAEAIPVQLRAQKDRKEFEDGGFEEVEPVATLRRPYLGVYAEVVRIAYWNARKNDGTEFYRVSLVSPGGVVFGRNQVGTVSLDFNLGGGFNDVDEVVALLADARKFIRWRHRTRSSQGLS